MMNQLSTILATMQGMMVSNLGLSNSPFRRKLKVPGQLKLSPSKPDPLRAERAAWNKVVDTKKRGKAEQQFDCHSIFYARMLARDLRNFETFTRHNTPAIPPFQRRKLSQEKLEWFKAQKQNRVAANTAQPT